MHISSNLAQKFSISRNGSTVTSGHSFRSNFIHLENCCLIGNGYFCLTTMTITATVTAAPLPDAAMAAKGTTPIA